MSSFVNLLDIVYPVGSIYISTESTPPTSTVGNTWTQIIDRYLKSSPSDSLSTGGASSYVFSLNENVSRACVGATGSDAGTIGYAATTVKGGEKIAYSYTVWGRTNTADSRPFNHHTLIYGETVSSSTEPPYITCYIWYRTA